MMELLKQFNKQAENSHIPLSKYVFFDFVDTSFAYVCSNKGEQHTIHNLFSEVKRLLMVENATDGVDSFFNKEDVDEDSEVSYKTATETVESSSYNARFWVRPL